MTDPNVYDLKLPINDYLPSIFFAIPKKKYTAKYYDKYDGSLSNNITKDNEKSSIILSENTSCIKNNIVS
jgi:hypothetical protein